MNQRFTLYEFLIHQLVDSNLQSLQYPTASSSRNQSFQQIDVHSLLLTSVDMLDLVQTSMHLAKVAMS